MIKKINYICGIIFSLLNFHAFASTQEQETLSPEVQTGLHQSIINPMHAYLVFQNPEQAHAWLSDMSNRLKKWIPDDYLRERYLTVIQYEASRAGLDPQIILSIITVESRFDKYAISGVGARGMMQVAPFWLSQIGTRNQSLFDIRTNVRYGCTILRYYLQKEHGNLTRALARYNGSLGQTWYPERVYLSYNRYWKPAPVLTIENGKPKYINYYATNN